jgi:hypothetical protein
MGRGGGGGGGEVEHRVALIVKNADPSEVFQIFLLKQTRPGNEIAGGEKDSDIWDLASVPLLRTAAAGKVGGDCDETLDEERLAKAIGNVEFNLDCLGLKGFAVSDAVEKVPVSCLLVCLFVRTALHCTALRIMSVLQLLPCGAKYVTLLQKYFSHPKFIVIFFSPTLPIKLKLALQISGRLLIGTQLDRSIYLANQQQVLGVVAAFYQPQQTVQK